MPSVQPQSKKVTEREEARPVYLSAEGRSRRIYGDETRTQQHKQTKIKIH